MRLISRRKGRLLTIIFFPPNLTTTVCPLRRPGIRSCVNTFLFTRRANPELCLCCCLPHHLAERVLLTFLNRSLSRAWSIGRGKRSFCYYSTRLLESVKAATTRWLTAIRQSTSRTGTGRAEAQRTSMIATKSALKHSAGWRARVQRSSESIVSLSWYAFIIFLGRNADLTKALSNATRASRNHKLAISDLYQPARTLASSAWMAVA